MKKRTLIRGMMICLGLTAFILCVMYIVNFRKMKTDESGKQNEDSAISAIVNLGRVPVQLTIPVEICDIVPLHPGLFPLDTIIPLIAGD